MKSGSIVVFPLQQRLRELAAVLILRFVSYLVHFETGLMFEHFQPR